MSARAWLGLAVFVAGAAACGWWVYRWIAPFITAFTGTGSGGYAFAGGSFSVSVLSLWVLAAPLLVFRFTRAAGGALAAGWRKGYLIATVALVAVAIITALNGSFWGVVAVALLFPMQAFFVVGALAIWIGGHRRVA